MLVKVVGKHWADAVCQRRVPAHGSRPPGWLVMGSVFKGGCDRSRSTLCRLVETGALAVPTSGRRPDMGSRGVRVVLAVLALAAACQARSVSKPDSRRQMLASAPGPWVSHCAFPLGLPSAPPPPLEQLWLPIECSGPCCNPPNMLRLLPPPPRVVPLLILPVAAGLAPTDAPAAHTAPRRLLSWICVCCISQAA